MNLALFFKIFKIQSYWNSHLYKFAKILWISLINYIQKRIWNDMRDKIIVKKNKGLKYHLI